MEQRVTRIGSRGGGKGLSVMRLLTREIEGKDKGFNNCCHNTYRVSRNCLDAAPDNFNAASDSGSTRTGPSTGPSALSLSDLFVFN